MSGIKNAFKRLCKFAAFKIVYPAVYHACCLRKREEGLVLFCEVRHGFLTSHATCAFALSCLGRKLFWWTIPATSSAHFVCGTALS